MCVPPSLRRLCSLHVDRRLRAPPVDGLGYGTLSGTALPELVFGSATAAQRATRGQGNLSNIPWCTSLPHLLPPAFEE